MSFADRTSFRIDQVDTARPSLLLCVRDAGNVEAWRDFDAVYRPMLFRFARSRGLGDAEAEDVVQHCFTAARGHIRSFDYDPSRGRFKGWLRTLANNRVRSVQRARREGQAKTHVFDRMAAREENPAEAFDRSWMDAHLKHALGQVRAEVDLSTFAAFVKYMTNEQPAEQVCRDFELSPNRLYKIKVAAHREVAREDMKELLDGAE